MAFQLSNKQSVSKIVVKEGPQTAKRKGEMLSNEVGVNITFDTDKKTLSGKLMFMNVPTGISSEKELYEAIEKAVNDVFQTKI